MMRCDLFWPAATSTGAKGCAALAEDGVLRTFLGELSDFISGVFVSCFVPESIGDPRSALLRSLNTRIGLQAMTLASPTI